MKKSISVKLTKKIPNKPTGKTLILKRAKTPPKTKGSRYA